MKEMGRGIVIIYLIYFALFFNLYLQNEIDDKIKYKFSVVSPKDFIVLFFSRYFELQSSILTV